MPTEAVLARTLADPVWYAFAAVLGAFFGSFGNVCIVRIPAGLSIVRPGSHCFACRAKVRFYDNLPVISYLVLRGRCRRCGAGFSGRYLVVELLCAALFAAAWHFTMHVHAPDDPAGRRLARFGVYALFLFVLAVLSAIDLEHKKIPDKITYPAIPLFLAFGLLLGDRPWWDVLLGCALGYGLIRGLSDGYYYLFKREGLGYGDGKLLAIVGGLFGWQSILFSLFAGSLVGTVVSLTVVLTRRVTAPAEGLGKLEVPFGPFLATGAAAYLFFGQLVDLSLRGFP